MCTSYSYTNPFYTVYMCMYYSYLMPCAIKCFGFSIRPNHSEFFFFFSFFWMNEYDGWRWIQKCFIKLFICKSIYKFKSRQQMKKSPDVPLHMCVVNPSIVIKRVRLMKPLIALIFFSSCPCFRSSFSAAYAVDAIPATQRRNSLKWWLQQSNKREMKRKHAKQEKNKR